MFVHVLLPCYCAIIVCYSEEHTGIRDSAPVLASKSSKVPQRAVW